MSLCIPLVMALCGRLSKHTRLDGYHQPVTPQVVPVAEKDVVAEEEEFRNPGFDGHISRQRGAVNNYNIVRIKDAYCYFVRR
jgi:hypothetical protein